MRILFSSPIDTIDTSMISVHIGANGRAADSTACTQTAVDEITFDLNVSPLQATDFTMTIPDDALTFTAGTLPAAAKLGINPDTTTIIDTNKFSLNCTQPVDASAAIPGAMQVHDDLGNMNCIAVTQDDPNSITYTTPRDIVGAMADPAWTLTVGAIYYTSKSIVWPAAGTMI